MKKIQVTTIEKMANVQIIELNASFIARVVRLQAQLKPLVEDITCTKRKFSDETKKYDDVLDENGNKVIEYGRVDGKILAETVLPFFDELCEAFEEQNINGVLQKPKVRENIGFLSSFQGLGVCSTLQKACFTQNFYVRDMLEGTVTNPNLTIQNSKNSISKSGCFTKAII